jgi:GT2 family glycosyltransferase
MSRIGLVTVTYNSSPVIGGFMDSLAHQNWPDWRLYVIDNASKDASLDRVRWDMHDDTRIMIVANADNRGVAAANNQGILAALGDGCDLVLLINNDVEFGPDLLSILASEIDRLDADMIVPKIRYFEPASWIWCAGGKFQRSGAYVRTRHFGDREVDRGQFDTARRIEYAPTCCMMIRPSVFQQIGLMDESFFVYCDDTDFCFRAWKEGLSLWYAPEPVLVHKVSSLTVIGSDFSRFFIMRGQVYFIKKHMKLSTPFWLFVFQADIFLRFIWRLFSRKFPVKRFRLEQRAFFEGLRIPLPAGK